MARKETSNTSSFADLVARLKEMSNVTPEQERNNLMEAARQEPKILDEKDVSLADIAKLAGIKEYVEPIKVSEKAEKLVESISKSDTSDEKSYESLRYEGFGPSNVAFIIETLTDNKNRSASSIRTVLQKNGGRLGETGSTAHMFFNCGVIHVKKDKIKEEEIFEISINAGAKDCVNLANIFEIVTEKEDFYKIKTELEKKIDTFDYSSIEWRPQNYIDIAEDKHDQIIEILSALEELDDVQNIFTNAKLKNSQ